LKNRGIGRARMFMGAVLLLAAAITWAIGLMMSPHGETVAQGTEYLRSTIVTFKRNSALGTLLLCALAAWLLFPARRPRSPKRDWGLTIALALLALSSVYTLIGLRPAPTGPIDVGQNYAGADMNADVTASGPETLDMNSETQASSIDLRGPAAATALTMNPTAKLDVKSRPRAAEIAREQPDPADGVPVSSGSNETTDNEGEEVPLGN
jgi:hypothetical protein